MKIAFVTSSLGGGGAERVVSILANQLCVRNDIDEVVVIAIIEDYVAYEIDSKVNYMANKDKPLSRVKRIYKRYSFLKRTLNELNPDVVISFCTQINIYSIFAMLGKKGKLIVSERNDPYKDPCVKWIRKVRDLLYPLIDGIVYQTSDAAIYFEKFLEKKNAIISNPIIDDLPEPFCGIRDKRIVTVARLVEAKNLPMLIHAFNKLSEKYVDYKLEIYGEGPERKKIETLIQVLDLEDKVFLKGYKEKLYEEIKSATCFVLPSDYEGISNAMLEALGLGIPTICTDCPIGGARMFIENMRNGILIPVGEQEALEMAMETIISNQILQEQFSKEAIIIRDKLSAKCISEQWVEFIKQVLA